MSENAMNKKDNQDDTLLQEQKYMEQLAGAGLDSLEDLEPPEPQASSQVETPMNHDKATNLKLKKSDKVTEIYDWKDNLDRKAKGGIQENSVRNVVEYVKHDNKFQDRLKFNEFSENIDLTKGIKNVKGSNLNKGIWEDRYNDILMDYLGQEDHLNFAKNIIKSALIKVASLHPYNPVKEFIEAEQWDNTPRAEKLFIDYLGAEDTPYNRTVARKWLLGAVSRIYQPGIKFETAPILTGVQGLGKSTLLQSLAGGPEWFSDSQQGLGKNKDDYQQLQGKWILELGELSALNRTSLEKVKGFLSSQNDFYRGSYSTVATNHLRKCVFIGTTNDTEYLIDDTGNRRFLPVTCNVQPKSKDPYHVDPHDVAQIWAEAKTWYDAGESVDLSDEMKLEAQKAQENVQIEDPEKDMINTYLNMQVPTNWEQQTDDFKQAYFNEWLDHNDPKMIMTNAMQQGYNFQNTLYKGKESKTFKAVEQTCMLEILRVVFNQRIEKAPKGNTGGLPKKVRSFLSKKVLSGEWKDNKHVKYLGTDRRGIVRVHPVAYKKD